MLLNVQLHSCDTTASVIFKEAGQLFRQSLMLVTYRGYTMRKNLAREDEPSDQKNTA